MSFPAGLVLISWQETKCPFLVVVTYSISQALIQQGGGGTGGGGGGISKYPLISVMNEKRDKCLILMLNLTVSKHTRSEAGKNKVIIKRVSNILMN